MDEIDDWEHTEYINRLNQIDNDNIELNSDFSTKVFSLTWNKLFDYQRDGCKWLYQLYQTGVGGILGDEMGLGKTAQICSHLYSLSRIQSRSIFLVLCPATLMKHWLKELHVWSPTLRSVILHDISSTGSIVHKKSEKFVETSLLRLRDHAITKGLVVITTYEGLRHHKECLQSIEWTGVFLDEGQKLKNPDTLVTKICKGLPCYHRIVLSGTPIQNSLKELWSIFDFIYPGRLGSLQTFELEFVIPIRSGGYINVTKLQKEIAIQLIITLQRIIKPYILRRLKDNCIVLPNKSEYIIFCKLTHRQRYIYENIISSHEVNDILTKNIKAFSIISRLRKLCNHPNFLNTTNQSNNSKNKGYNNDNIRGDNNNITRKRLFDESNIDYNTIDDEDDEEDIHENVFNIEESGKLIILNKILPQWFEQKHKLLIFSQSIRMLNYIELLLNNLKYKYSRLDGSTRLIKRSHLIDQFNNDPSIYAMLLTTRTGGLGISLTAANRIILIDPDWNPMTDIQARERAWRIGQTREVTIYRLITRGTIEEKIYQRQISKIILSNRVLDNSKHTALFSKNQLQDLFELTDDLDDPIGTTTNHSNTFNSNIDYNLPIEGEIIIDNNEYYNQITNDVDNDNDNEDEHVNLDINNNEILELEDKDVVLSYRHQYQNDNDNDSIDNQVHDSIDNQVHSNIDDNINKIINKKVNKLLNKTDNDIVMERVNSTTEDLSNESKDYSNNNLFDDKKLLELLFNNDTITGIYNHNYIEEITSNKSNNSIRSIANQTVNDAMNRINTNVVQPSNYHPISSNSLLTNIRNRQNLLNRSTDSDINVNNELSIKDKITNRLNELFDLSSNGFTSQYLLSKFPDLGDQYAVLFKQILKSIANSNNGLWYRK